MRTLSGILCFGLISSLAQAAETAGVPTSETLPGTPPLVLAEPLDVVMVRGISEFAERELASARDRRKAPWLTQGAAGVSQARAELRKIIGMPADVTDRPLLWYPAPEGVEQSIPLAASPDFTVTTCHWEAFAGVTGTGLLSVPVEPPPEGQPRRLVVVIPDADQTPEQLFGLQAGLEPRQQTARRYAADGSIVLCPLLIDRSCTYSGHPDIRFINASHREYIYRLCFELGLHPVGMEVAKILSGIKAVEHEFGPIQTLVQGIGEGGLIALCSAAVEGDLIDSAAISGYFDRRERVWQEPIYRNLFGQLNEFGDAELASLVAPRPLVIDNTPAPEVSGPPPAEKGVAPYAAPGVIRAPSDQSVAEEFQRAREYYRQAGAQEACALTSAMEQGNGTVVLKPYEGIQSGSNEFLTHRRKSQIDELVRYSQRVLDRCDNERAKLWSKADMSSPQAFEKSMVTYADWVHASFIGKLPRPTVPPNPRTRKVIDEPTHVGYEVMLDVFPAAAVDAGVIAGGILLLPKDLAPGQRRPVVVCQHGLEGTPMDTITMDQSNRAWAPYKGFSTELVKRGFIVYAPQNPYRGEDQFRVIQRKSNPLGRSLFSYIIEQHRQTLRWLAALPWVDRDRIGFYGLSYGGKTAVRVPNLLKPAADEPGYCLSICSGDFDEWIRKNVSADDRYSYVYTKEYEIWEWDMGHVANYAELAWLMVPRPFMVERGHDDGVAPDEWVAGEYAKVQRVYDKLGIGDQSEIEYFNGPHTINGQGTYRFLHRHLNWPEKKH